MWRIILLNFRDIFLTLLATGALCAGVFGETSGPAVDVIQIEMGLLDHESKAWDGSISISEGDILALEAADFIGVNEHLVIHDNKSWTGNTQPWPTGTFPRNEQDKPDKNFRGMFVRPVRFILKYQAKAPASITILFSPSAQLAGQQASFSLSDIPQQGALALLEGQLSVRQVPMTEQITDSGYQDDYPAIAADKTGDVWVTWVGYKQNKDDVFMRYCREGKWSKPLKVTDESGDIYGTACALDGGGKVWIIWSQQQKDNWHLFSRSYNGKQFGPIQQLTEGRSKNFFHRTISDKAGNIHLVWHGFHDGQSDIFLKSLTKDGWSEQINLSGPQEGIYANDWCPTVAVEPNGKVWVAWDTYETGSYNIRLRSVEDGKLGPIHRVTDTPRFHANASIAVDGDNRLWVAYEEAEENWGKDIGVLFKGGNPLYLTRKIRVAVLDKDTWYQPSGDLNQIMPEGAARQFIQSPQLCPDNSGTMWVIFRPRTFAIFTPPTYYSNFAQWELLASRYTDDNWTSCIPIPASAGRNEGPFALSADLPDTIPVVWVADHRALGEKPFNSGNHDIVTAMIPKGGNAGGCKLIPRVSEPPVQPQMEPEEPAQVAAVRNYVVRCADKEYRIYRGDLHRHSDISLDGIWEGDLVTVYRYLLDAAAMDFGAITDHVLDWNDWEYWWRQNCKVADMFNVTGYFSPLFAYERSVAGPNGHRNVFFANRGVQPLVQTAEENEGKASTGSILYPYLLEHDGICVSHTSCSWNHGTDWRDNHSMVEPVVEIFQGCRSSSEYEGAPLTPSEGIPGVEVKGYRPDGWVRNAWEKGYKLGVIASSDHWSTHISYAFILTDDFSREGLIGAMKKRHTYGATSNILLDFRMKDSSGEHIMGDETLTTTNPELIVNVVGTSALKEIVVIRGNDAIFTNKDPNINVNFVYNDTDVEPGNYYYYVRVEQQDGHVAWSSPIWVDYKPLR